MKDFHTLKTLMWGKIKKLNKSSKTFFKNRENVAILFFAFFCIFYTILAFIGIVLKQYNKEYSTNSLFVDFKPSDYPFKTKSLLPPDISANAAIVMDNDSKVVLFEKNKNLLFSLASTTKIMTALVALDYYKNNDVLTIESSGLGGINLGFEKGEKILFKDLLYAMLLPSSNDAALSVAINFPGGEKAFVAKMNDYAKRFNLYNMRFSDPVGLGDEKDHATPLELARLASIALENNFFSKVVSTKTKVITDVSGSFTYDLINLNKLLGTDGITGVKTGFTNEAGEVLVTSKKTEDGHTLIGVVMNSQDRFADSKKILDHVEESIIYLPIHP